MLTELHVKNLALIDEADVNFGPGLNILTGETGAGKSILIGSINLALGHKMQKDMLRKGAQSCLVELAFQIENPEIIRRLKEMDVDVEDGQLIISRKFTDGRSVCRLNGEMTTASKIRTISSLLLDIHGQHEHQKLLYPENQLEILDAYGKDRIAGPLARVQVSWSAYRGICEELKAYEIDDKERERELSFLKYEIQEIEDAALVPGEEEDLEKRYRLMSNSKKIAEALNQVHQLTGYEEGAGDMTGRAVRELSQVAEYDETLSGLSASISDIDNLLNDFNREVSEYLSEFTFSEEEFFQTEQRLDLINNLKAKYGKTTADILAYLDQQKNKLSRMENFDQQKQELIQKKEKAQQALERDCQALTEQRQAVAEELSEGIRAGLKDLNFLSVDFEIQFQKTEHYGPRGRDAITFMISTNPGESVRPLADVVSGGELSRIMLAIKTLLADKDATETLIFDEIDTGISGRTAQKVSEKMAKIGRNHQVICITHLAQIAAMADHHFEIAKSVENASTISRIRELDAGESVEELARILGGAEITQAVRDNAREMKQLAEKKKQSLETP
ncbi:MAG: DNA repair protein RecN [Eubacterium sp.]|nr:DNA repair protein RecN [Eubacterium sp.]